MPGEADGVLDESLRAALRARDEVDAPWQAEAGVADWTARMKAWLVGELSPDDVGDRGDDGLRIVDDLADEWTQLSRSGRLAVDQRDPVDDPGSPRSVAGDRASAGAVRGRYGPAPGRRTALKIVGVELAPDGPWTDVRVDAFETKGSLRVQHTAHWRVHWSPGPSADAVPLELVWRGEQRARLTGEGPGFVDTTASAFEGRLPGACVLGLDTWRRRLDSLLGTGLLGHQGLAIGDVDADGREDLYVCQPGGLPNRLFLSGPDGTLVDASVRSGADYLDRTASALLLHLDADPHLDLALATATEVLVLAGDGAGRFELRRRIPASTTTSLAASDFDLDGDLDVYVCGYVSPYDDSATPLPYHDANNGERNQLLRNDGEFAFVDVTAEVGLDAGNRRFSFAASWADYDRDGDQDLYVANDFGRNNLYRNEGGRFEDVAAELGVEDIAAGMGVAWGDVDNDGWEDLYVSNMFSAAGSRVAYEPAFHPAADGTARDALRRHARGNTLFRNLAGKGFADVTSEAGVGMGRWAWGSILIDLDDDGWLDALVPNGMITGDVEDDL